MKISSTARYASLLSGVALAALAGFAAGKLRARITERRWPARGQMVGPKGARLHYLQQGSGPDLVLLHGAAVTSEDMRVLMDELSGAYRVTAFDRAGHGHSDPAPHRASPLQQALALHAAVEALGIERPILVGHSLGAAVALAYGAAFPAETAGVVALAPLAYSGWGPGHLSPALHAIPVLGPALSHSLFAISDPLLMRLAPRLMFAPQSPTARFRQEVGTELASRPVSMRSDGADMIATAKALTGVQRRYSKYPVPVQIVVGDADRVLKPARQALRLAKAIPGAELQVLPGVGHMLHHFRPDAVRLAVDALAAAPALPRRQSPTLAAA